MLSEARVEYSPCVRDRLRGGIVRRFHTYRRTVATVREAWAATN